MTEPYEPDMADDDSRRCIDCRNGFWPDGDIAVCQTCEEWVCAGCRADHDATHATETR